MTQLQDSNGEEAAFTCRLGADEVHYEHKWWTEQDGRITVEVTWTNEDKAWQVA
jgi:hypothetical protein